MDLETPSVKAVRFRAREEVAFIEAAELGEPEFASAPQRQRRRRCRQRIVMRNTVRSPSYTMAICLLAIVSVLFVYWLFKYLYIEANKENSTGTMHPPPLTTPSSSKSTSSTPLLKQCASKGGQFYYHGWCYRFEEVNDFRQDSFPKCPDPFVLSTVFTRDKDSFNYLGGIIHLYYTEFGDWGPNESYIWVDAIAYCTVGERILTIKSVNGTLIDKDKYYEYFGFQDSTKCKTGQYDYGITSMYGSYYTIFNPTIRGDDRYLLCELKI